MIYRVTNNNCPKKYNDIHNFKKLPQFTIHNKSSREIKEIKNNVRYMLTECNQPISDIIIDQYTYNTTLAYDIYYVCQCENCDNNEISLNYPIDANERLTFEHKDYNTQYHANIRLVSSGLGCTKEKVPCIGIHIYLGDIEPISNPSVKGFIKYIEIIDKKIEYYFAYNSESLKDNNEYLIKFIRIIAGCRDKGSLWTNFIIIGKDLHNTITESFENQSILYHRKLGKGHLYINEHLNIRIFNLESCSNANIVSLIYESELLIFLSGDQSFAEGIAAVLIKKPKVIFYQIQPWKITLIKQYFTLAHYFLSTTSAISSAIPSPLLILLENIYINNASQIDVTSVTLYIKKFVKKIITDANILHLKINNFMNIEDSLIAIINEYFISLLIQ